MAEKGCAGGLKELHFALPPLNCKTCGTSRPIFRRVRTNHEPLSREEISFFCLTLLNIFIFTSIQELYQPALHVSKTLPCGVPCRF